MRSMKELSQKDFLHDQYRSFYEEGDYEISLEMRLDSSVDVAVYKNKELIHHKIQMKPSDFPEPYYFNIELLKLANLLYQEFFPPCKTEPIDKIVLRLPDETQSSK